MLVDVLRLRRAGLRLRQSELEPPLRGHLVLTDDDGRSSSFRRPTRGASLVQFIGARSTPRSVITPLFDVHVLRIEADTITILGTELEASMETRRVMEHGQVWRCTLVRP